MQRPSPDTSIQLGMSWQHIQWTGTRLLKGVANLLSLPNELRQRLVDEGRISVAKMGGAESPREYLYYFSVFFGEAVRVLNWHWDAELALIWSVIQHTYNAISARASAIGQGDTVVELSPEFFGALIQTAGELVNYFERPSDETELTRILGRFAELAYVTTGNGYYLLEKGMIKL